MLAEKKEVRARVPKLIKKFSAVNGLLQGFQTIKHQSHPYPYNPYHFPSFAGWYKQDLLLEK